MSVTEFLTDTVWCGLAMIFAGITALPLLFMGSNKKPKKR